jgi:curved DNA-binding protein CbpA
MSHTPDGQFSDYYEVLQVSSRADAETIERVFRYLAKRYHPDNQESGNAEAFNEVANAYHVLSDPVERAKYDVQYERTRETRWRIFGQEAVTDEIAGDQRVRQALLSILYAARRNNANEPGVGTVELERLLGVPESLIRFHIWYLKENNWIERIITGHLAITAVGIDKLMEMGGPARLRPYLLESGDDSIAS